jgi:hypothetical protein
MEIGIIRIIERRKIWNKRKEYKKGERRKSDKDIDYDR